MKTKLPVLYSGQGKRAMQDETDVQYISDSSGKEVGVLIPIEVWREIESERETAYLLQTPAMKSRLLAAMKRTGGPSLEEVRAKLGI